MARQRTTPASPAKPRPARKPAGPKPKAAPSAPLTRPEPRTKFTLFNLLGQPRAWYVVETSDLERPPADPSRKTLAHSIIVVDRSGSMCGSLPALKEHLVRLLTLDEYSQFNLLVSLVSYSGRGDARVHFERGPIADIMRPGSPQQEEIRRLQVTGLTCISGGLRQAASLVRDGELTAITLHTDGYANDPSPSSEANSLAEIAAGFQGRDAYINAIAYTDYADFRLLSQIANGASGACVKAGNIPAVYDALANATRSLGSSLTPPVDVPLPGGAEYQVFVSHAAGRVNGAAGPLRVVGLRPDHDATVYRYRRVTEAEYQAMKDVPEAQTSEAVFALSRARLAEGSLNTAKYALASTFDATLVEPHTKALTNVQVAALAQDLDALLFNPGQLAEHTVLTKVPVNTKIPVVSLVSILEQHKDDWAVSMPHLAENYRRRGLKRLQGTRDEAGKLVEPWLKAEPADADEYVRVSGFDVNRNTATLNMLVSRRVKLVPREGGEPISRVAGVSLDRLSTFNNYTLVGDGELNVDALKVRIASKRLFEALWKEGVLENEDGTPATKFVADTAYILRLDPLPLVPPFAGRVDLDGVFAELARLKVLASLVAAHLKEESADYTPEQVEELKKHYLSKSLFLNFPTTNPYTDLQQALAEGSVDTRTSYKIDLGDRQMLNLGKLHSANKFLERMYEVLDGNGTQVEKATFEDALDGTWKYRHKTLSARTKVTKVDEMMRTLFDDFLGVKPNGSARAALEAVGAADLAAVVAGRAAGKQPSRATFVEALADARAKLEARQEALFRDRLSALVFYIGATGLLPDEIEAKAMTADQIAAKYPELALSKDEKEGTFFEIGDAILTVYAKAEYFSR